MNLILAIEIYTNATNISAKHFGEKLLTLHGNDLQNFGKLIGDNENDLTKWIYKEKDALHVLYHDLLHPS